MELRRAMRTTPATREFTEDEVTDAVLYDILDQARFAPNGGNRQGWRVVVVRDLETKWRIGELYDLGMREYAAFLRAGLVPFAAADDGKPPPIDLDAARAEPLPTEPSHIATAPVLLVILPVTTGGSVFPFAQNILLAARDAGLGGHLTSLLARQESALRALLEIPEHFILATLIPLGRPVKEITRLSRARVEDFTTTRFFDGPPLTPPG